MAEINGVTFLLTTTFYFILFIFSNNLVYVFCFCLFVCCCCFGRIGFSLPRTGPSLVAASGGPLLVAVLGLFIAVASPAAEHRLQGHGPQ